MRMLIFPYGHDCEPLIRHAHLLEPCYEIASLVSPGGWGLAGKTVALGDGKPMLTIHESPKEASEAFDCLFIPPFEAEDDEVENRLADEMGKLLPHVSHVICAARLTQANKEKLLKNCQQANPPCVFTDYSEPHALASYGLAAPAEKYPSLRLLDVPVAIVAGCWEKTDKFEISLALRERFLENGYRISQVGSRDGCEMLGFHSFPGFMLSKDVDAADKIVCFNRWIAELSEKEQPDLILITIPGAIQDFSEHFTRGFGLLHHQVFQAVLPDALVMCTFYMSDNFEKILRETSTSCKYKFGTPIDVFHMSNLFIDINDSEERDCIVTNSIYRETVSLSLSKKPADCPMPIFNGLEATECDRIFELLIEKLSPSDVRVLY